MPSQHLFIKLIHWKPLYSSSLSFFRISFRIQLILFTNFRLKSDSERWWRCTIKTWTRNELTMKWNVLLTNFRYINNHWMKSLEWPTVTELKRIVHIESRSFGTTAGLYLGSPKLSVGTYLSCPWWRKFFSTSDFLFFEILTMDHFFNLTYLFSPYISMLKSLTYGFHIDIELHY